jgi:lipid II:glycine glycyltransferase (peptidoglycan interpeptide bridge formation enzyme)
MLYSLYMAVHVVQSPEWGRFKTEYGTKAVRAGGVQYTVHKLPFTSYNYAYCPKVNPSDINWDDLEDSLSGNSCVAVNFDVPDITKDSPNASEVENILRQRGVKAPRDTFAKKNILLDLTASEEELLKNMHNKHRYNIGLSERKGVTVSQAESEDDFKVFFDLLSGTAQRQKYFIHPETYYRKIWEILGSEGMCRILTAYYNKEPLASWMFFVYDGVLYYPYGGSSEQHKNVFASTLLCWEGIRMGKNLGLHTFDMWGAADDINNKNDPWYGFTNFKLKFGGRLVEYIDSYDLVINRSVYEMFNVAQNVRWKILKLLK